MDIYGNGESNTCSSDHKLSFLPFFFFVMFTGPPYSKVCIPLKKSKKKKQRIFKPLVFVDFVYVDRFFKGIYIFLVFE